MRAEASTNGPRNLKSNKMVEIILGTHDLASIFTVDNAGQTVRTLAVMMPQRAELVLAPDVPHGETKVLVLHVLRRSVMNFPIVVMDDSDPLAKLQLLEDRDLSRGLEPQPSTSSPWSCWSQVLVLAYPSLMLRSPAPTSRSSLPDVLTTLNNRYSFTARKERLSQAIQEVVHQ